MLNEKTAVSLSKLLATKFGLRIKCLLNAAAYIQMMEVTNYEAKAY